MNAVFTGSFDPVTLGHLDIIKRAASMFDTLYVVLCANSEKKCTYSEDQRLKMLALACENVNNVKIDKCNGLLAEYTEKNHISYIVRGIRDTNDLSYELSLATINRSLRNNPETVFIPSKPEYSHVSSTYARDMIKYGEDLNNVLPESVINYLMTL